jgi:site-specific recombinase
MYHDDDQALITEILPALEIDQQYIRTVETWNDDRVAQIRRCGRAAGRRLGYRIRTFATDPEQREDRRRVVCVVVTDSTPQDEQRIRERSELLLAETLGPLLS